jgi:hypothetical protein
MFSDVKGEGLRSDYENTPASGRQSAIANHSKLLGQWSSEMVSEAFTRISEWCFKTSHVSVNGVWKLIRVYRVYGILVFRVRAKKGGIWH